MNDMSSPTPLIETVNLSKWYGSHQVLKSVSLAIAFVGGLAITGYVASEDHALVKRVAAARRVAVTDMVEVATLALAGRSASTSRGVFSSPHSAKDRVSENARRVVSLSKSAASNPSACDHTVSICDWTFR